MVKVIFVENVEDYKLGEVRDVPDGYARNFLVKRGLAKIATESEVKNLEEKISKLQKEEEKKVKAAQDLADKLQKSKVTLTEEVNEEGHLYGAVTNREVGEKLEEMGFELDPANIVIEEPIKELGDHEVLIKTGHGVETAIKITVERKK